VQAGEIALLSVDELVPRVRAQEVDPVDEERVGDVLG